MSPTERIVYQFPISHFCEKTRWNLDAKGLSYTTKDLIPALHMITARRVGGIRTVPILVDRGTVIGDSAAIALHLERAYPERPLFPDEPAARARVLELEAYFGEKIAPRVRQLAYGRMLQQRRGSAAEAMFAAYPSGVRVFGKVVGPLIEMVIRRQYSLAPSRLDKAHSRVLEGLDRIAQETGGDPSRFLAGDRLTIADITAASVLAPIVASPGSPWFGQMRATNIPDSLHALRAEISAHPGARWVDARYAQRDARASA